MKKILFVLCFTISYLGFGQQLELGINVGYGFTNIANSRITEGRAVIGDALWGINNGFSVIYYFKNPLEKTTSAIHFEYSNSQRGSKSENYSGSEYSFKSQSLNLNYRRAGSLGNNFGIYADIGFGYNILENENIYKGNVTELTAFEKINEPLIIKNNEVTFLYGIGVDKLILKGRCSIFLEFNGDAGITKINQNFGSYRTQSLGFSAGFRYIIKLKKESN